MTRPTGKPRGVRSDYRTRSERVAEIKILVAQGLTRSQIARRQGISGVYLGEILKDEKIELASNRERLPQARRIIEETVTAAGALARGLELTERAVLDFTPEEAGVLLHELKESMVGMYQLSRRLKEIKESNHEQETRRERKERHA